MLIVEKQMENMETEMGTGIAWGYVLNAEELRALAWLKAHCGCKVEK